MRLSLKIEGSSLSLSISILSAFRREFSRIGKLDLPLPAATCPSSYSTLVCATVSNSFTVL